jgi:two-component sensor histidine kinase
VTLTDDDVLTFDHDPDENSTETIDFSELFPPGVTYTGSFELDRGKVRSFSKLLNALPMPALLVESSLNVMYANEPCSRFGLDPATLAGGPLSDLFPYPTDARHTKNLLRRVFQVRKAQIKELMIGTETARMWGRVHFRSLRIATERFVLVLVEDLTWEKKQLELTRRHQEELKQAHAELEKRVDQRTAQLKRTNEILQQEILERKKGETQIRASLREKEVLLNEVHHRVKNNLQIVSSLLALQGARTDDERFADVMKDSQNRIRSMSMIHEQLYSSKNLSKIDFSHYVKNLIRTLLESYSHMRSMVALDLRLDEVNLGVDTALPCGLIINELVSNCLKHAFPENRKGKVVVKLRRRQPNVYELSIADDGIGLPEEINYHQAESLGLKLVTNLAESQLGGRLGIKVAGGTAVKIVFQDR